jgi:hypothetical protein
MHIPFWMVFYFCNLGLEQWQPVPDFEQEPLLEQLQISLPLTPRQTVRATYPRAATPIPVRIIVSI